MTYAILADEFDATARKVERQLSIWRGEWVRSGIEDDGQRRGAQAQMDPGKFNALKRALKGKCFHDGSVSWVLDPLIPHSWDPKSREYLAVYQMALLYTRHPYSRRFQESKEHRRFSFTKAAADANDRRSGIDAEDSEAQNNRINTLLRANRDEIVPFLAQRIRALMNGTEEPIDWVQLAKDLRDWSDSSREVQIRWGQDWYGGPPFMRAKAEDGDQEPDPVVE